jgi:hypothetical protein
MPAPEVRNLNDYAVLWEASSTDGYGRFKLSPPIEIGVRWEGSTNESVDPQNTVQLSLTEVFVDREVPIGSVLWHGRLRDLPTTPTNLMKVAGSDTTPDIKNRFTQYTVTLIRYGNALPEVVVS